MARNDLTIEELGFLQSLPRVVSASRHIKATREDLRISALLKKLRDKGLVMMKFQEVKHGEPIRQDVDLTMAGIEVVKTSRTLRP
jgi:hypothetical protein